MLTFIKKEIVFITGSVLMLGILIGIPVARQLADSNQDTVYQAPLPVASQKTSLPSKTASLAKKSVVTKPKITPVPQTRPVHERGEEQNDD